ncbi:afadin- and alpha-actinin-binding protein isoform X2 [Hyperolius riggenbachi]|uniref:afadin- and alpha-actinin-binding protein isoform X2 n=1 Tax=Hyperolius riggenbachi TaxID=752182 RepID=UPI0035A2A5E0
MGDWRTSNMPESVFPCRKRTQKHACALWLGVFPVPSTELGSARKATGKIHCNAETRLISRYNSEPRIPSLNIFQSSLTTGKTSQESIFCSEDNIEQCIDYLEQELKTLGFPSLQTTSKNGSGRRLHVVSILNCIYELLQRHGRDLRRREEVEMQLLKINSDFEYLQNAHSRLKDQQEVTKRENAALLEKERQQQCKNHSLLQLLKNEKEEAQKLQNIITSRSTQHNHNMKRKEREYNKLKERLYQLVMDKKDKKISIDVLNYVGRADGKRMAWRTSKTDAKNEEEMYKVLLSDYEQRQKQLLLENGELKKVLQQMKKEMISLLQSQKPKAKDKMEDSLGPALSDEDDPADSSKETLSELSCEAVREQLVNSIRQQWRILKSHVEKLDNQAAQVRVASPDRKGLIDREEYERKVEKMKDEIQECRETIKSQQHLLQQQIIVGSEDDTSALLQDCYLLEDQERLQEEWRLFHEQKNNFEKERRNFTEAAIRLGHERKMFEEDRALWLKHQFLNMSLFCERKSAEYCQPQRAFSSPEQESQNIQAKSPQTKRHSTPPGDVTRIIGKSLPAIPPIAHPPLHRYSNVRTNSDSSDL